MKALTQLHGSNKGKLTSNDIFDFAPENPSEARLLQELVRLLKQELKEKLLSDIAHRLR